MGKAEGKFSLQVPSSTDNLALIRKFINGIGIQAGLDQSQIAKLELAVDEACANIIEHAYDYDRTKEVVIRADFDAEVVEITIIDTGRGFDPESISMPGLDQLVAERKTGGLGLRLIRTLMDEVHYEMVPHGKNELRMIMQINRSVPRTQEH